VQLHDTEGLHAAEGDVEAIRVGQQLQDSSQRGTGAHQRLREGVVYVKGKGGTDV